MTVDEDGCAGEPCEHVLAAEAALGQAQEVEEHPSRDAPREVHDRRTIHRDLRGRELLVDEPCVRIVTRVEQGDAAERCAGTHCVDDGADCHAHLVVCVGREHDARTAGVDERRGAVRKRRVELGHEPLQPGFDLGIGGGVVRRAREHHDLGRRRGRVEQNGGVARHPLRQEDEHDPEVVLAARAQCVGGADHQVLLVVPRGFQRGAGRAVDADDVGRACARPCERVEPGVGNLT